MKKGEKVIRPCKHKIGDKPARFETKDYSHSIEYQEDNVTKFICEDCGKVSFMKPFIPPAHLVRKALTPQWLVEARERHGRVK